MDLGIKYQRKVLRESRRNFKWIFICSLGKKKSHYEATIPEEHLENIKSIWI